MAEIIIDQLKVTAIVGIMEWERQVPQELLLDLKLTTDIVKATESKNIDDAVDYSRVCIEIEKFIQQEKFELLETLLHECCHFLLNQFSVDKIFMRCIKTQVLSNTSGVGIEMDVSRKIENEL